MSKLSNSFSSRVAFSDDARQFFFFKFPRTGERIKIVRLVIILFVVRQRSEFILERCDAIRRNRTQFNLQPLDGLLR